MLHYEYIENGARIRHWSDIGMMIRQIETGILYEDAVDVVPCSYTYEETDEPIPVTEPDLTTENNLTLN